MGVNRGPAGWWTTSWGYGMPFPRTRDFAILANSVCKHSGEEIPKNSSLAAEVLNDYGYATDTDAADASKQSENGHT
jgi:hypothetical protein